MCPAAAKVIWYNIAWGPQCLRKGLRWNPVSSGAGLGPKTVCMSGFGLKIEAIQFCRNMDEVHIQDLIVVSRDLTWLVARWSVSRSWFGCRKHGNRTTAFAQLLNKMYRLENALINNCALYIYIKIRTDTWITYDRMASCSFSVEVRAHFPNSITAPSWLSVLTCARTPIGTLPNGSCTSAWRLWRVHHGAFLLVHWKAAGKRPVTAVGLDS